MSRFFVREDLSFSQVVRPFQRHESGATPPTLQIRVAPRGLDLTSRGHRRNQRHECYEVSFCHLTLLNLGYRWVLRRCADRTLAVAMTVINRIPRIVLLIGKSSRRKSTLVTHAELIKRVKHLP
jgi:hypothetical protein